MVALKDETRVSSRRAARLYLGATAGDLWEQIIQPWFREVTSDSWRNELPCVVAVPTRGQVNHLKTRLIAEGISQLGLRFVTPLGLEALLAGEHDILPARPEHLRLLLAIAASEMENRPNESEALAAKAISRTPGSLLRTLCALDIAGWEFEDLALPSFRPIVERFNELRRKCDFLLPGDAHRRHLQQAERSEPRLSRLLITGFDGAHWSHWFLLRTAVAVAEDARIALEEPSENLPEADLCWIGSWEETCGAAERVTSTMPALAGSLFTEEEMRGKTGSSKDVDFIVGTNIAEQSDAIAQQCVRYLATPKCQRLGVIFPGPGALSRLVSQALGKLGILHNDGLAHFVPGIFESPEWLAWVELQRSPRLHSFLRFLNALTDPGILSAKLSRDVFEKVLRRSYDEILLDDLDSLRQFCADSGDEQAHEVADALRGLSFLPSNATLDEFLKQTESAISRLGGRQPVVEIQSVTRDWPNQLDTRFSRGLFLRWLEETGVSFRLARSSEGDHPYARVQLLSAAQAQNQEWSHLIFAGGNEGTWPPAAAAEFARAEQIEAFNRKVRQLNTRAAGVGSQGEGHISVRGNHSLYLGPVEQRAVALRQFEALFQSVDVAVTIAASLVQEDAPERLWNPSESFSRLYHTTRRAPLTEAALKSLRRATRLSPRAIHSEPKTEQTLAAFKARRDAAKAAGEYDFALRADGPYHPKPILSVSDLERVVSSPAIVWLKRYLGVEPPDDLTSPWAATSGKWVHHWLASIGNDANDKLFSRFPSSDSIDERIRASANQRRTMLQKLCQSLGRPVPDWWNSGWLNALYLARHLGSKIATATGWGWMIAEWPIGRDGAVHMPDGVEVWLRGRVDLVLAQQESANFSGQKVWIIDYKTNSTRELKKTNLHDALVKGGAVQLGLYSLAIQALGAAEVCASVVSSAVKKVSPQLTAVDLLPHTNVFSDLAEMQRTGIFGMKGDIRPSFGYSVSYPLATLPIDQDILEDKWALTHPSLVLEKEEWEIW